MQRILSPGLLSHMAPYDVASNIRQALGGAMCHPTHLKTLSSKASYYVARIIRRTLPAHGGV